MEELILTLEAHLAGSGLSLYLADAVPENTPFPYLTAEITATCRAEQTGRIRLTLWCVGDNANLTRMVLHSTLSQYFPHRGITLTAAHGRYILMPGQLELTQSGAARGLSTDMAVSFYPAKQEGST